MTDGRAPLTGVEDCIAFVRSGEKPRSEWVVGTEHEKIGVFEDTLERVPYAGERGIAKLLGRIAERDGWKPVLEGEHVIALEKGAASITLEPGGQLELSGAPLSRLRETCREFSQHVDLVNELSADMGIVWLALGVDPFHAVPEIPVMPKRRYEVMRAYLPTRGRLGLDMMHASATVQANFDFADEADMARKMRTAMGCTAIVSALFANSTLSAGAPSGFASKRVAIWRDTDPDRCGLLHFVFEPGFGYRDYVEWALDAPMFFVVRGGRYTPARGLTFRKFLERGFEGERATVADWSTHLTTLFPEVRLKRILEVRGADAVPRALTCALPAIWKGLLYDDGALQAAWQLVADLRRDEREAAQVEVARHGLDARIGRRSALELARELVAIASEGLARIAADAGHEDERGFLDPLREQIALGRSPGRTVLERWQGEWARSPARLIEYARY